MLHSGTMPSLLSSILDQVHLNTIVDIGITALLIYWLFKLIRGTRAVRLVIGVSVLFLVYALAVALDLRLLTQILQAGAVVGLFAWSSSSSRSCGGRSSESAGSAPSAGCCRRPSRAPRSTSRPRSRAPRPSCRRTARAP